jgi:hemerythrin-like metal-binding protein
MFCCCSTNRYGIAFIRGKLLAYQKLCDQGLGGLTVLYLSMRCSFVPLMSWKPEYSVNNAELDNHHIKLFDILNTVYENIMNSLEVDSILPIIEELSQYTKYHFSIEEQNMREKEFHEIDGHIAKHLEFSYNIEMLKTHYHGNNLEVARELIIILGDWLLRHVLTEDREHSELSA